VATTWLNTGSPRGLGRALPEAVLAAGAGSAVLA
jgi:NAD(P)-dependent dehydrogenase (short-subunit alcohol dehydrogenase family)